MPSAGVHVYDYIIVGAGSAGCVLAARLTEDPTVRVLLLEAGGPDKRREIHIPAAFSKLFKTSCDWAYYTEPEPQLAQRNLYWPRGKVLGGSSSINAMIYIRGHRVDYDGWRDLGNPGWGYSDALPLFKRSEDQERGADEFHGTGGPLRVSNLRCVNPLSEAFVQAGQERGFPPNKDFNGAAQEGFGIYQVTQRDGKRHSAATAFLRPAMGRPNLTVRTDVHVSGILFEGPRAVGVSLQDHTGSVHERAQREILICSGAIGSPQLLMLSGIGAADHLRKFNIPVVLDLPGVGENLQDHPAVPVAYDCKKPVSLASAESLAHLLLYMTRKDGPLTTNVAEAGAFLNIGHNATAPDLQFHFGPAYYVEHGFKRIKGHAFTLGPTLIRPASRGSIRLRSNNPLDAPAIRVHYFSEPEDTRVMVEGLKLARDLANSKAFGEFRGGELLPGPECKTDEGWSAHISRYAETLYHPVGTCKMGMDESAVVDPELRVHGVEGLRVVDASIMPTVPGGNTNAPTIMIAEKAAEMIKTGKRPRRAAHSLSRA